jgi:hypothetical protein
MERRMKLFLLMFGNKTAALLPEAEYIVYNAPHGLFLTEKKN